MNPAHEIWRVSGLPVTQNRMFATREAALACARGDMVLVQDLRSGLIFNQAFRPELLSYDTDYQSEQSLSPAFARHLDGMVGVIRRHLGGRRLVEVGCGQGHFLGRLAAEGFDITGLDPAYHGQDPRIRKASFSAGAPLEAGGIVLRHVLEHLQNPTAFLHALAQASAGARVYIEVPCFDWTLEHRAWFDILYEHVNYFRKTDFLRMFGVVHEAGHSFSGQYLYVVAELSSLREPVREAGDLARLPPDFLAAARARPREDARGLAIWGGASKGVLFALYLQRHGVPVDAVIDINPARQGHYLAASGLLVQSPAQALPALPDGADIYVMNGNYLDEIRAQGGPRFNYVTLDHDAG